MESQRYERQEHEILAVYHIPSKTGQIIEATGQPYHVMRRHHTMYVHATLSASAAAIPAGGSFALTLRLHPWDIATEQADATTVLTGEDRTFDLLVNGQIVGAITTTDGQAAEVLQLIDPGAYTIEVAHETARGTSVEVTVT